MKILLGMICEILNFLQLGKVGGADGGGKQSLNWKECLRADRERTGQRDLQGQQSGKELQLKHLVRC